MDDPALRIPPSHIVYPVFFLNSAQKIQLGVTPSLEDVTRGGPPPETPLVTPLKPMIRPYAVLIRHGIKHIHIRFSAQICTTNSAFI